MALGENQNKKQYTVTTSNDSFEFPYKYWDDSEILVTKLASGVETEPTFTIAATNGNKANGGTVTLTAAVESCTITIERIVAYESEADYQRGALSPTSLTEGFDKGAAMSQQLADRVVRSLEFPVSDGDSVTYNAPTASLRAGKALGFTADGSVTALDIADEGGAFTAVNSSAGLSASGGTISAKADDTSIEFDGSGDFSIKDGGVATAHIADDAVTAGKLASDAVVVGFVAGTTVTEDASNLASTSGIVVAISSSLGAGGTMTILSDSSNPPTTTVAYFKAGAGIAQTAATTLTAPILAGDYYKVTSSGTISGAKFYGLSHIAQ